MHTVKVFVQLRQAVVAELAQVPYLSVTTDAARTMGGEDVLIVTGHHINASWEMRSVVLAVLRARVDPLQANVDAACMAPADFQDGMLAGIALANASSVMSKNTAIPCVCATDTGERPWYRWAMHHLHTGIAIGQQTTAKQRASWRLCSCPKQST